MVLQRLVICGSQFVDPIHRWSLIRMMLNGLCTRGNLDCKHRGETKVRELANLRKDTTYSIV